MPPGPSMSAPQVRLSGSRASAIFRSSSSRPKKGWSEGRLCGMEMRGVEAVLGTGWVRARGAGIVERVTDEPAQLLDGSKLFAHAAVGGLGLERRELVLCVTVSFDISGCARVILVRGEDEDLTERTSGLALDGAVELHLSNGDRFSSGTQP